VANGYWFRQRRVGWGWGLPCSWQGWAFFIPWLALLIFASFHFMPQRPLAFTATLTVMALILLAVCHVKGEPLTRAGR
jgi:hypothetical protein